MKVKFANRIYEVLFTKELAGLTMYAVEDEPNHIDWLINVEVVDAEKKEPKKIEQKPNDKVEQRFKVKYAGSEYNVLEVKDIAGVTFYGIEDEPNHIDYVKAENCEIIRVMTFTTMRKPTGAR